MFLLCFNEQEMTDFLNKKKKVILKAKKMSSYMKKNYQKALYQGIN